MTLWNAVLWLHLLAMAFFVGGQLMLAGVLVPLFRNSENREQLRAAARRFGIGSLIAIGVLLATGSAMASHLHLWSDSTLHIKLGLVVLVGVLVVVHMRRPALHAIDGAIFVATLAIVWCGVVIAS
jgi:putative copper export protein